MKSFQKFFGFSSSLCRANKIYNSSVVSFVCVFALFSNFPSCVCLFDKCYVFILVMFSVQRAVRLFFFEMFCRVEIFTMSIDSRLKGIRSMRYVECGTMFWFCHSKFLLISVVWNICSMDGLFCDDTFVMFYGILFIIECCVVCIRVR